MFKGFYKSVDGRAKSTIHVVAVGEYSVHTEKDEESKVTICSSMREALHQARVDCGVV